jgi:hypothetical protein
MTEEDIGKLLHQIEGLKQLDDTQEHYHINEFLANASKNHPTKVVRMLLGRVLRDQHEDHSLFHGYQPIPFGGFHLPLSNLRMSPDYPHIVRDVLLTLAEHKAEVQFWGPRLMSIIAAEYCDEALGVVLQLAREGSRQCLLDIGWLLSEIPSGFILTRHAFVADFLELAAAQDKECLHGIQSGLLSVVIYGEFVRPVGEPAPEWIRMSDTAEKLAGQYHSRRVVADFYQKLADSLRKRIQQEVDSDFESME